MYHYTSGTERWCRFNGSGDVRGYQPKRGWKAVADLIEYHPTTGVYLGRSEWWIREVKQ